MSDQLNLEIDAGNTRIKWRYVSDKQVVRRGDIPSQDDLSKIFEGVKIASIGSILVSSVACSELNEALLALCGRCGLGGVTSFVTSAKKMGGITFSYEDVSRLGVDRCLAMIGAWKRFPSGVLVLDAGSAITADFVDGSGCHVGGYILPGIRMLERSLLDGTANVLVEHKTAMVVTPGCNTEQCVENGRYFMLQSLVKGLVGQASLYGIDCLCVTGGDGRVLADLIGSPDCYYQDLVFEGLEVAA